MGRKVFLVFSSVGCQLSDLVPANKGRQSLVDSLIIAYDLHSKCEIISVANADASDLTAYHSPQYVAKLLEVRSDDFSDEEEDAIERLKNTLGVTCDANSVRTADSDKENTQLDHVGDDMYGLEYDTPVFPFMNEYVKFVAGSSLSAARCLLTCVNSRRISINWYGGRHHCFKNRASGFCYVNDVVLAILKLRQKFKKVAYVDLDLHHGDGVERAFQFSHNVTTCSVHMHDIGFYPGTGGLKSSRRGMYNIPLKRGLKDETMVQVVRDFVCPLMKAGDPEVIVLQLGCDGLVSDPSGQWNLTIRGYWSAVELILKCFPNVSFLVLGGGGYDHTEAAKCWAYITKMIIGDESEWTEIPDHDHQEDYSRDSFQFWTVKNQEPKVGRKDENTPEYLRMLKNSLDIFM
ncbi:putative histone deacetylase [Clavispora lusitaniae]|uniref:Histone deacetylase n=1 Tax=Clavispora lusitaniae TaxID=36911 RepID=A0AA91Q1G9_CLALS|nr:putative histone deacetylase [Clavispora lusitaniae]